MASLPGYLVVDAGGRAENARPHLLCAAGDASRRAPIPQREQVANVAMSGACCKVPKPESLVSKAHRNDDRIADPVPGLRIRPESLPGRKTQRDRTALSQASLARPRFGADP